MHILHIFKLDCEDQQPVSKLAEGEHIIGRGTLLQCDDRRVSRNHGIIKIGPDKATIMSTHINPCYFQAASSRTIMILQKDTPKDLDNGDKFALLPDNFWFKVKLELESIPNGRVSYVADEKGVDLDNTLPIKREVEEELPTCTKRLKIEADLKVDGPLIKKETPNEVDKNTEAAKDNRGDSQAGPSGSSKTQDDPQAGPSGDSNKKQTPRVRCWYGEHCYRKNSAHLDKYSHIGDDDFESDTNDDRPMCPYGAACYRRNKDHRKSYKHPRNVQKPGAKGDANPKRKRGPKPKYTDTPEDDYDLEDPFINDSGTDYSNDSLGSSESESDSECSAIVEEETKRLLKEAKRFTKKKEEENEN